VTSSGDTLCPRQEEGGGHSQSNPAVCIAIETANNNRERQPKGTLIKNLEHYLYRSSYQSWRRKKLLLQSFSKKENFSLSDRHLVNYWPTSSIHHTYIHKHTRKTFWERKKRLHLFAQRKMCLANEQAFPYWTSMSK